MSQLLFRIIAISIASVMGVVTFTGVGLFSAGNAKVDATTQSAVDADFSDYAIFAGGCFWCIESDLEKVDGVGDVVSGYSGGDLTNPTYRNHDGHREVVRAPFNSDTVSYRTLVDYFLRHIDPLDGDGQFCDRGFAYSPAIYYVGADQQRDAQAALDQAEEELGKKLNVPLLPAKEFWVAEDYHQDYYKKNPVRYKWYRSGCGRDKRVKAVWSKAA